MLNTCSWCNFYNLPYETSLYNTWYWSDLLLLCVIAKLSSRRQFQLQLNWVSRIFSFPSCLFYRNSIKIAKISQTMFSRPTFFFANISFRTTYIWPIFFPANIDKNYWSTINCIKIFKNIFFLNCFEFLISSFKIS